MDEELTLYKRYSKALLAILGVILAIGAIMVYSSSYIYAKEIYGSSSFLFNKQLLFISLGILTILITSKTKKTFWLNYCEYINWFLIFLLILTLVPGISYSIKGASRWLKLGSLRIQPGEYLKISVMLCTYKLISKNTFEFQKVWKSLLGILLPLFILLLQPDFGTFFICSFTISITLFISNFDRKMFYSIFSVGLISSIIILLSAPYRVKRLLTFLDPWKNPKSSGFQIIQSFLAFANGSFFGQGLGNSNEKLFYLPEAHNDFIFSVIGEELGFLGVLFVILMFVALIYVAVKIIFLQKQETTLVISSSLIFLLGFQTFFNMGVVLGLLPTKGLNLPFISYGGSSLISSCWIIGLFICFTKFSHFDKSFTQDNI